MKVCYFGAYERTNPRNKVIIRGLNQNGIKVIECHQPLWEFKSQKAKMNPVIAIRYFSIYFISLVKLVIKYQNVKGHDVVVVGYPGYVDVYIAKLLALIRRKPLVFDAYLSLYGALVHDRKVVKKGSFMATCIYLLEKYACQLSDKVLLDTYQHIAYFIEEFNLERSKFERVFIGADDSLFKPMEVGKDEREFKVIHFGKFIPLHGMEYIIRAAKCLEQCPEIRFEIIGSGQLKKDILNLARRLMVRNVTFIDWIEQERLIPKLASAQVCLGIFGNTRKAREVVPNKVYEGLAMKKAVLTGDTPAMKEEFTNEENCLLCRMADERAIAEAILRLKEDSRLRERIEDGGYRLYLRKFSPKAIGKELRERIEALIHGK